MNDLRDKNEAGIFNRNGLASLSDLQSKRCRELFHLLEKEQAEFLLNEKKIYSPDYKWPHKPLYWWSRVWEYPYIYHHIENWVKERTDLLKVVDVGSGTTFFPFSIARLGCNVFCTDYDIVCEQSFNQAQTCVSSSPGNVDFKMTDGSVLPFNDQEIDVVYCISVLEHIPHFDKTIAEISRILKPGGLFLLTIDLSMYEQDEIGVDGYIKLNNILEHYFKHLYPDKTIHPADMLMSHNGPFGFKKLNIIQKVIFYMKQYMIKPLLLKKRSKYPPVSLAIQGYVLSRK